MASADYPLEGPRIRTSEFSFSESLYKWVSTVDHKRLGLMYVVAGGSGNIAISNIVCAIDRDAQSRDTLEWASSLAVDFQARLSVVHAIPRLDPSLGVSSDLKAQMEATVREEIGNPQSTAAAKKMAVSIQEGDVADAVCGYAKSVGAHLVVIGRGKDRQMGRLRTNAYGIIRQSPCPVVSI